MIDYSILSWLIWLPIAGGAALLVMDAMGNKSCRQVALLVSIATFLLSTQLFSHFDSATAVMQFQEDVRARQPRDGFRREELGFVAVDIHDEERSLADVEGAEIAGRASPVNRDAIGYAIQFGEPADLCGQADGADRDTSA